MQLSQGVAIVVMILIGWVAYSFGYTNGKSETIDKINAYTDQRIAEHPELAVCLDRLVPIMRR